ncbi:Flp family type IVb pilin [Symbiobacterium thermophilum]|uniref:Pilus subunit protein n=1 Tax=Symbiobacterium thermophilum (strain DSM 24528 / JCM 14929 / IAM 14863 / T) TaxID=292459 RepID=Q67SG3_SYMTH|nr:Flp family type IVb pilin [Symbiobacterium thermophilum]BAD39380.1 pilus subunit protein [Symbiobacterium thermophilum IAM 14863]
MSRIAKGFRRLVVRQEGQGMTEYGLIIALIAVVLITTLTGLNKTLDKTFNKVTTQLNNTVNKK